MSKNSAKTLEPGLYRTPFSAAYWRDACKELTSVRMLAVAAILIAVRVALKSTAIPVVPPNLKINFGFFINALGAMIFGPVVAVVAAAISDTLGCLLFPTGVYFFPFIFTEIAGSLIFALFLYRAPLSGLRVTLSRFCVCFFVNIVIQTPIMMAYYKMYMGTAYVIFDLPRICKNLVLFPFESLLLMLFLNVVTPLTYRMGLTCEKPKKLRVSKRLVAFVLVLFLIGASATAGYGFYDYNTRNHATEFETEERAAFNQKLATYLDADGQTLVLVNRITKTAFEAEEEVTFSVYDIAEGSSADGLWGLKNSAAKGEKYKDVLTFRTSGTATLNKDGDTLISIQTKEISE